MVDGEGAMWEICLGMDINYKVGGQEFKRRGAGFIRSNCFLFILIPLLYKLLQ